MTDLQAEEPEWVQRMRARGYNIRRGTSNAPLNEEPDAVFYPPPMHPLRRALAWIPWGIRKVLRSGSSPYRGRNGALP
jgi:hypothetical protein